MKKSMIFMGGVVVLSLSRFLGATEHTELAYDKAAYLWVRSEVFNKNLDHKEEELEENWLARCVELEDKGVRGKDKVSLQLLIEECINPREKALDKAESKKIKKLSKKKLKAFYAGRRFASTMIELKRNEHEANKILQELSKSEAK